MTAKRAKFGINLFVALSIATPAIAHTGGTITAGLWGGVTHPLFGLDHVLAMIAVGLWGAFLGPPAIWLLPIVFPLVMALGAVLGIVGIPLLGAEIGIAMSAIVLGGCGRTRFPTPTLDGSRVGRHVCDLPWPCSWRRTAAGG